MSLVEAARFYTYIEASIAKGALEAEDIPAILFDVGVNSAELGPLAPVRLMVHEDDLEEAQRLLAESA